MFNDQPLKQPFGHHHWCGGISAAPSPSGGHFPPAKVEAPGFARLHAASPKWDKFATVLPFRPSRQIFVTGVFMAAVIVNLQAKVFIGSYRIARVEKPKIKHKF